MLQLMQYDWDKVCRIARRHFQIFVHSLIDATVRLGEPAHTFPLRSEQGRCTVGRAAAYDDLFIQLLRLGQHGGKGGFELRPGIENWGDDREQGRVHKTSRILFLISLRKMKAFEVAFVFQMPPAPPLR